MGCLLTWEGRNEFESGPAPIKTDIFCFDRDILQLGGRPARRRNRDKVGFVDQKPIHRQAFPPKLFNRLVFERSILFLLSREGGTKDALHIASAIFSRVRRISGSHDRHRVSIFLDEGEQIKNQKFGLADRGRRNGFSRGQRASHLSD